ncbi:hypothetical protein JGH11_00005 [Dysgonomonas sp. Marseille-P4677]|uniref:hypothetical protein n=1 Tax=Dysgonomonas sp. Marseille-P4677 TaxID=2364790 RepID=UPI00191471D5|nr:hypothetical protein [Dysgonomonas sp. Marseille-P4677]MBK5719243.1 hypothetical protein [Dysgonomonas sp. Marseille-P4677]
MSTILIIIAVLSIIFKLVNAYNEPKQGPISSPESISDIPLRNVLNRYSDFSANMIVESSVNLYLFALNRRDKEFIVICDPNTVYRLSYDKLKDYVVKKLENSTIALNLFTTLPQKPVIFISCFNEARILAKEAESGQHVTSIDLDDLYNIELEKIEELALLLDEILAVNENILEEHLQSPYVEDYTGLDQDRDTITNIEIQIVDTTKEERAYTREEESIKEEEPSYVYEEPLVIIPSVPTLEKQEPAEEESELSTTNNNNPENVTLPDENIQISLTEIEEYSRGKFLDSDIQSAFSEARMKGKKHIYITKEQLENLKK